MPTYQRVPHHQSVSILTAQLSQYREAPPEEPLLLAQRLTCQLTPLQLGTHPASAKRHPKLLDLNLPTLVKCGKVTKAMIQVAKTCISGEQKQETQGNNSWQRKLHSSSLMFCKESIYKSCLEQNHRMAQISLDLMVLSSQTLVPPTL